MRDKSLRNRHPSAVIAIAAIALLPRAVEIFEAEFQRQRPVGILALHSLRDIAHCLGIGLEQIDLSHRPSPRCAVAPPRPPLRAAGNGNSERPGAALWRRNAGA